MIFEIHMRVEKKRVATRKRDREILMERQKSLKLRISFENFVLVLELTHGQTTPSHTHIQNYKIAFDYVVHMYDNF